MDLHKSCLDSPRFVDCPRATPTIPFWPHEVIISGKRVYEITTLTKKKDAAITLACPVTTCYGARLIEERQFQTRRRQDKASNQQALVPACLHRDRLHNQYSAHQQYPLSRYKESSASPEQVYHRQLLIRHSSRRNKHIFDHPDQQKYVYRLLLTCPLLLPRPLLLPGRSCYHRLQGYRLPLLEHHFTTLTLGLRAGVASTASIRTSSKWFIVLFVLFSLVARCKPVRSQSTCNHTNKSVLSVLKKLQG
eukprot:scpid63645/ scgid3851/ 